VLPQGEGEADNRIGDIPGRVVQDGNREPLVLGNAENGEQVDEEELVEAHVAGRGRDGDADVEQGADEYGVPDVHRDVQGAGDEPERHRHREPDAEGDGDEIDDLDGRAYAREVFLYLDDPLAELRKEGALQRRQPRGEAPGEGRPGEKDDQRDAYDDQSDDHPYGPGDPGREARPGEEDQHHEQQPGKVEEPVEKDRGEAVSEGEALFLGQDVASRDLAHPGRHDVVHEHADEQGSERLPEAHGCPGDLRPPPRGKADRRGDEDERQKGQSGAGLTQELPYLPELDAPQGEIEKDYADGEAEDGYESVLFHRTRHYNLNASIFPV